MKKLILILLIVATLVNFGSSALASSKKPDRNKLYNMFNGAFSYLIENMNDKTDDVSQKKAKVISLLAKGCNHDRDIVQEVYSDVKKDCIECLEIFMAEGNQSRIKLVKEHLNEMSRIARVIGIK